MIGVVALVVFSFDYPLVRYVSEVQRDRIVTAMERDAYVLAGRTSQAALVGGAANVQAARSLVRAFDRDNGETAAIIDAAGFLVASNDPTSQAGADYTNRPEVAAAIRGEFASGVRESVTLGDSIVYVAVPIVFGDDVLGAVRLTSSKSTIDDKVDQQVRSLLIAALISLVFAAAVAVGFSGLLIRPVNALRRSVDQIAEGELDTKIAVGGPGEIRHLSRAFARMQQRIGSMLESQRSFAGDAAHQLRSPLTALRLRLEQALNATDGDASAAKAHIEAALADTDRMVNLTESLLRLARTEGVAMVLDDIALRDELSEMVDQWSPLAEEDGVDIELGSIEVGQVRTSRLALREIVGNYLDNAITHSPDGTRITVTARRTPLGPEIVVSDQGPGMSEEERERAFDRFWRGRSDTRGTGLGLAIVAQLAANLGLRVELRSGAGGGLDAVLLIPAQPD
jgi:signal transduction histidine kinase